jgi:hypothetical protein
MEKNTLTEAALQDSVQWIKPIRERHAMKRSLCTLILIVSFSATQVFAALPFSDPFASGGPAAGWIEWFNTGGTLTIVSTDTDWLGVTVNPPAGSDGFFGKSTFNAPGYATHGWRAGEITDTNYTAQVKLYVPQVNTALEPDDFLYQQLIVYVDFDGGTGQYIRLHAQNNIDTTVNQNRARVQVASSGFKKTAAEANVFSGSGWHTFRAVLNGSTGNFYIDDNLISDAPVDWTPEAPAVVSGQFGFGQYIDGAGERSVYVDDFSAVSNAGIADWTQFE